jgi:hypothetical protein
MISKSFGSDEGFDTTREAMELYVRRNEHFNVSMNETDAVQTLNVLEFVMMHGALEINEARAAGDEETAKSLQVTLEWAEQQYSAMAAVVGVELI